MVSITNPFHSLLLKSHQRKERRPPKIDMSRVATIILGGGEGKRLFPLTQHRCKPAISFGGRYRLIDIPLSNSINSGCHKIFIITQFLSSSLNQHIFRTYRHDIFNSGFLELLPAEQKPTKKGWFEGTADAVRQNLDYFYEIPVDYFFVLSGDQLYTMNYQEMLRVALETNSDAVIAALPISDEDSKRMGVLQINNDGIVTDFIEKPQDLILVEKMRLPSNLKIKNVSNKKNHSLLGSMGIYLFKREALFKLLEEDPREDFGKHLLPTLIKKGNTAAYLFDEYWEDIGTIDSFYKANMALTEADPEFNSYDEINPIFTTRYNLPGAKIYNTVVKNSLICEGCIVEADEITHSILGPRTTVKKGSIIRDSYLMGSDFYTPPIQTNRLPENLQVGENCLIIKTICDKNVCIGNRVQLTNKMNLTHYDGDNIYIRDGIIVIPRGVNIPDGFIL